MDGKRTTALFINMNNPVTRETYMIPKNFLHTSDDLKPEKQKDFKGSMYDSFQSIHRLQKMKLKNQKTSPCICVDFQS